MMPFLDRLFGRGEPLLTRADAREARAFAALHAASFHRGWSAEEFEQLLTDRSVLAHRASRGRRLLGFILSRFAADEAEILSVAVARAAQGQGLARKLLQFHLGHLAGLGVRAVYLEVDEDNAPALRLYRRAGFREVGQRSGYYPAAGGSGGTARVLRRDLA
jgi:ribosomal-protein-alanine N-acetyltransferase